MRIAYRQPFGTFTERLPAAFGSSAASASWSTRTRLVVLTRRIRSPRASATVALRREEVDVVAPGERLQRHQPGWSVSKSGVIACAATCAASAVADLLPAERRAIEPVVQDHGVVLAPAVVDCEERGDPAVGRGQPGPRPAARSSRYDSGGNPRAGGPDGDRLGGCAWATPPSERPWPRSAGRASRGPAAGARSGPSGRWRSPARVPRGSAAAAARRRPRRPAPRSAAPPACSTVGAALRTGRHPTTVARSTARCARSGPGQGKALARLAHESHSLGEDDAGIASRTCVACSSLVPWRFRRWME